MLHVTLLSMSHVASNTCRLQYPLISHVDLTSDLRCVAHLNSPVTWFHVACQIKFKKSICHRVEFKGGGPQYGQWSREC